jgi:hypothetical protein
LPLATLRTPMVTLLANSHVPSVHPAFVNKRLYFADDGVYEH